MLVTTPADAIRARRLEEGISRRALAERAGVSVTTVQLIEENWTGWKPATGRRIATALGLTLEELT